MRMIETILVISVIFILIEPSTAKADTLIFKLNITSPIGYFFNTTSGAAPAVTNNGGNDWYYTFTGSNGAITNSSTIVFPTTSNSSWWCKFNFSITDIWGRAINLVNGSTAGAYGGTDTTLGGQLSSKNSCDPQNTGICIFYWGQTKNAYQPANDGVFYLKNFTGNGSNISVWNIPYQAGQGYSLNLSSAYQAGKLNYIQNWRFGQPDDSPVPDTKVSVMECYNVSVESAAPQPAGDELINQSISTRDILSSDSNFGNKIIRGIT